MSKKNTEKLNFEARLARLQEIVGILEKNTASLEESMALYKEGTDHSLICKELLENARHEIKILDEAGLKDFKVQDEYITTK